ncbi:surface-adhesin E family protein [Sphingopyxis sp. GW247-27LB]|uniref:surface-adhesin E family protein n=1 Tax=Sphingopyxis sp. GW247-27LB TaxID=2012632 RepID=UPI000BA504D7|nr:surface-adhesin E family protein [Sphingopyxis sp. GW247-27LB]PAL19450.1 hypothetical protein CD928_21480 [Sphingopyxis sp. GW247-27LB]
MRLLLAAVALLPLVPTEAAAESWYLVGGNENTRTYVDLSSLRPLDNKMIGDIQSVYSTPLDGDIWGVKIRQEFDCTGNYFRTLQYSYYGARGAYIDTEASETINEQKVPAPDSINEAVMEFVCYRTGGTQVANPFDDAAANF